MFKANEKLLRKLKKPLLMQSRHLKLLKRKSKLIRLPLTRPELTPPPYRLTSINSRRPLNQPLL